MARKTKIIEITEGRDAGKRFFITEMSAFDAERFIVKVFHSTGNISENISFLNQGHEMFNLVSQMPLDTAQELWNELLTCVQVMPSPEDDRIKRPIMQNDIEDFQTLVMLKMEAVNLIMSF